MTTATHPNTLKIKVSAVLICVVFLAAWKPAQAVDKLQVVASIRPLALLVDEIAGDQADVSVLVEGGASPHSYSLKVSDMRRLQSADLVVWLGPEFERFLAKPLQQRQDLSALALGNAGEAVVGHASADHDGHHSEGHAHEQDMHLWLNPDQALSMLQAIAERLAELQPESASTFKANLARAKQRVQEASAEVAELLAPVADRQFGVSHDAYGHFADYFGLQQAGSISAMPDQALSARHLGETLQQLENAECLIVEPSESPATVKRLERLFKLPTVTADHLALDPKIRSYPELIRTLGQQFRTCLE